MTESSIMTRQEALAELARVNSPEYEREEREFKAQANRANAKRLKEAIAELRGKR